MSLFNDIIDELVGVSGDESAEHPCRNCPSDCALAPDSCNVCKPYKEKLIDALYKVEHIDEVRSKYVVKGVGETTSAKCPYCGATTSGSATCEYCGSPLAGGSDKIVVSSAADIPNPILDAQDIIFERYDAVKGKNASSDGSDFLSQVFSLLGETDNDSGELGSKMTESEIEEAASAYGVSVADYLEGLDNGRYLTLKGRKAARQAQDHPQGITGGVPANANVPGLAGMAVGSLIGDMLSSGRTSSWSRDTRSGSWNFGGSRPMGGPGGPGGPGGRGGMGGPGGPRR